MLIIFLFKLLDELWDDYNAIFYLLRRYNEETKFSVTPSFVLTHSSDSITPEKCIEHCLTALATLLHVFYLLNNLLDSTVSVFFGFYLVFFIA